MPKVFKKYIYLKETNNKTGQQKKLKYQRSTRSWKLNTVHKVNISSEGLNNRLGMTEDSILENRRNLPILKRQKQKTMKENNTK